MGHPRLLASELTVGYGEKIILNNLSLVLEAGETLAVLGRSGCGKSTLLRTLCGLQRPQDGDIWLDGQKIVSSGGPLFEEWEIRRNIMMVSQVPCLLPHLTAIDNIALGLRRVRGLKRCDALQGAEKIAIGFGLGKILKSYPEEMSGGEIQRVQLARAVALSPRVLLLDEVTSALDPQTIQEVVVALKSLRALAMAGGQSIILVTHLLWFALEFADRIIFLHQGVVFEEGRSDVFLDNASKSETREFLASARSL